MKRSLIPLLAALALTAQFCMGNFSVSHFTRFDVEKKTIKVTYVLDLAEIPTWTAIACATGTSIPPPTPKSPMKR